MTSKRTKESQRRRAIAATARAAAGPGRFEAIASNYRWIPLGVLAVLAVLSLAVMEQPPAFLAGRCTSAIPPGC